MNEAIKKLLDEETWNVATISETGVNVVPVGFKVVLEDGSLAIGDVFMVETMNNVKANGKIAISCFHPRTHEGYQIKGTAEYLTAGPIVETFQKLCSDLFKGAMAIKGAIKIKPEKIIVTTPGADNKKVIS